MAQPTGQNVQYLGAVAVEAEKQYTAASFAASFTGANIFVLKTRTKAEVPIMVSINKTAAMQIEYNETSAFDGTTSLTYVFSQDCIIGVGKIV